MDNRRVADITASRNPPENPFNIDTSIASIQMSKRKFNDKLSKFISDLEKFRKSK